MHTHNSLIKNQLISHFFSFYPFSLLITPTAILNKIILKIKRKDTTANVLGWGKSHEVDRLCFQKRETSNCKYTRPTSLHNSSRQIQLMFAWKSLITAVKLQPPLSGLWVWRRSGGDVVKSEPSTLPRAAVLMSKAPEKRSCLKVSSSLVFRVISFQCIW